MTRLSDRLTPGEDADALARDVIEVTLAGLRTVPLIHSTSALCEIEAPAQVLLDARSS